MRRIRRLAPEHGGTIPALALTASPETRLVVDAITATVLCCDCLARRTGLTDEVIRRSLIAVSRRVHLNTWTACRSCGAVDETYGIVSRSVTVRA